MTRSVLRNPRVLAAGLVLAVGSLAGCSAQPGTAVQASYSLPDGSTEQVAVSESEVQSASTQLAGIQGVSSSTVMNDLLWLPAYESIGAQYGVTVTQDDARTVLDAAQIDSSKASEATLDVARSAVYANAFSSLDQETLAKVALQFQAVSDSAQIETSPRYQTTRSWLVQEGQSTRVDLG